MKKTKNAADASAAPNGASAFDWSTVGHTGFENVSRDDLGIPFLSIIQDGSPEYKKTDPQYAEKKIDGCSSGDIFNTLSRQLVYRQGKEPVLFVPCSYDHLYMEWKPRNAGGGLVRGHRDSAILNEATRGEDSSVDVLRNGNLIVPTCYFYGFVLVNDARVSCVIGMKSTQLKKARAWLNIATSIKLVKPDGAKYTPPMFSHTYRLSTQPENNNEGSWWGWKIETGSLVKDMSLIQDAIEFSKKSLTLQQRAALPAPSTAAIPFA